MKFVVIVIFMVYFGACATEIVNNSTENNENRPDIFRNDITKYIQSNDQLVPLFKLLWKEVEHQKREIDFLKRQVVVLVGALKSGINCTSLNPCHPGVECVDTTLGPKCGACPNGTVGDGIFCEPGEKCSDNPCFAGVSCQDTEKGAKCGTCPHGHEGDGRVCVANDVCSTFPCASEVDCSPIHFAPFYKCGKCPQGYTGNGTECTDINECEVNSPCDSLVECINLAPGFQCDACPGGYEGLLANGISAHFFAEGLKRQSCVDIDECARGVAMCTLNSDCHNIPGSYECRCRRGYLQNAAGLCSDTAELCQDELTVCEKNSTCHTSDGIAYRCECLSGYAGNGLFCAIDSDLDGYPEVSLNCEDKYCKKDNCPFVANSDQADLDGDGLGDLCDTDKDGDRITNYRDNCPNIWNMDQTDSDGDGIGDQCDNCPTEQNANQMDSDGDGKGDLCDGDMDGDGIEYESDNCPTIKNPDQLDTDGDGFGDVCDNCPTIANNQSDVNNNFVGDVCETSEDKDKDGVQDDFDNCPSVANSDQLDIDGDRIGDACDDDMDNDTIKNKADNCPMVPNPFQNDTNINIDGGDACENDFDGDKTSDNYDACPRNPKISSSDFSTFKVIPLGVKDKSQEPTLWNLFEDHIEIVHYDDSRVTAAISPLAVGGLDMEGTFSVDDYSNSFVGFIFGYQASNKFYAVLWQNLLDYWDLPTHIAKQQSGVQLRFVNSTTGPGTPLGDALWHIGTLQNQTKLVWKHQSAVGWLSKTNYRWKLWYRPKIGVIRLKIYEGDSALCDSLNIYEESLKGGRFGVISHSHVNVKWNNLIYKCNDLVPYFIHDDLPQKLREEVERE